MCIPSRMKTLLANRLLRPAPTISLRKTHERLDSSPLDVAPTYETQMEIASAAAFPRAISARGTITHVPPAVAVIPPPVSMPFNRTRLRDGIIFTPHLAQSKRADRRNPYLRAVLRLCVCECVCVCSCVCVCVCVCVSYTHVYVY